MRFRKGFKMNKLANALELIAAGIATSLGDTCETVVHDKEKKITYIKNGHISGRDVGNTMDETVFEYIVSRARKQNNIVVRLTRKPNGELMKSTTMVFFDETGRYDAMLCFSMDLTQVNQARNILDSIMNLQPFENNEESGESMSIVEYTRMTISDIIKEVGKPSTLGSKEIKMTILRKLDEKGVFLIKDSVPQVCELLSISQATLYNYLREIRVSTPDLMPFNNN